MSSFSEELMVGAGREKYGKQTTGDDQTREEPPKKKNQPRETRQPIYFSKILLN